MFFTVFMGTTYLQTILLFTKIMLYACDNGQMERELILNSEHWWVIQNPNIITLLLLFLSF